MTTPHTLSYYCRLTRPLLLAGIASMSILGGIVPDLSAPNLDRVFASAARADDFNDETLRNYARSLLQIEPLRQSALAQIRAANGGDLPNLVCNQPDMMGGLNDRAKSLFVNYCNQCKDIAESHGLSIDLFNAITQSLRSNPELKEKIRKHMH